MGSNGPVICDHTPGAARDVRQAGVASASSLPPGRRGEGGIISRGESFVLPARGATAETTSGAVVSPGGPRVGMRGGFLDIPQRDPGIQRRGDESMAKGARPDGLGDPCPAGDPAHDPPGTVPVQAAAVCGQEDRSVRAFRRWPGRSPGRSVAPAGWLRPCRPCGDHQGPVPALHAQRLDVSAGGFRVA